MRRAAPKDRDPFKKLGKLTPVPFFATVVGTALEESLRYLQVNRSPMVAVKRITAGTFELEPSECYSLGVLTDPFRF